MLVRVRPDDLAADRPVHRLLRGGLPMICRAFGHRYRAMTGGRSFVTWDRCTRCGIVRMTKGSDPRHWHRIPPDHMLARRLFVLDLAAILFLVGLIAERGR